MDKLKKKRKTMRAAATRTMNEIQALEDATQKEVKLVTLTNLRKDLEDINEKIMDLLLDTSNDDVCEEEQSACQEITEKIDHCLLVNSPGRIANDSGGTVGTSYDSSFKLPKLSLEKYDLTARQWIAFWAQFKVIDENKKLSAEQKFRYLLNTLKEGTKGRKIADSYPPSEENYVKVLSALKSRFGNESAIIEVYTRDLLALALNKDKKVTLSNLFDTINSKVQALETLGVTTDNVSAVLYPLVQGALPLEIAREWERQRNRSELIGSETGSVVSLNSGSSANPLKDLLIFLEQEVLAEERLSHSFKASTTASKPKLEVEIEQPTAAVLVNKTVKVDKEKVKQLRCIFCGRDHHCQDCKSAGEMSSDEKEEKVKISRRCFRCLRWGHRSHACRTQVSCSICKGDDHIAVMHKSNAKAAYHAGQIKDQVFLKTILIRVKNVTVRALIDDGSSRSYIKASLAKALGLVPTGSEYTAHSLFGGKTTKAEKYRLYDVQLEALNNTFTTVISCLGIDSICCDIPRVADETLLRKLEAQGIYLSDVGDGCPEIEMLIGAENLGSLLTTNIMILKECGVTAIETKLGWCLIGALKGKPLDPKFINNFCMLSIDKQLWGLECLGIESQSVDCLDEVKNAKLHFENTIRVNAEGRYEVELPWRAGHPSLPDNRALAESRLRSVTAKLKDNFEKYDEIFTRWSDEGIIEEVVDETGGEKIHYLPHRPVFKPGSLTTKVRPVFDASAKCRNGVALNDCLLTGPNLLKEIPEVLTRFRAGCIGVTGDIKSAFLQISLKEADRDCLRFLWWRDDSEAREMVVYRHTRVVFGVSSSPFLLNATLKHHLEQEKFHVGPLMDVTEQLQKSFYCDDLVASVESDRDLNRFVTQAQKILQDGKFELHKWAHTGQTSLESNIQKVLGLQWDVKKDHLFCVKPGDSTNEFSLSKRGLLSLVSRVFDPVGFLAPAMIVPKILLQKAWRENLEWDAPLPDHISQLFVNWIMEVEQLESCVVGRWLHHGPTSMECCTLHVFADGSAQAYAACIYLRCAHGGRVSVRLVAAKARVVPAEKMTIPRVELLAALISVRLMKSLGFPSNVPVFYYSDSSVALAWITKMLPWKTWVGNRVQEIRENTAITHWRHVEGICNPADVPSRGCSFRYLRESFWFDGPDWLYKNEAEWPCHFVTGEIPNEALSEGKTTVLLNATAEDPFSARLLRYFSDFTKIWRVVGWIRRFIQNAKNPKERTKGQLSFDELMEAEKIIFRVIQNECVVCEKISNLQIVTDSENVLRVKTRLERMSGVSEEFIQPIILSDHPLVHRLIENLHREYAHAGATTLLSILRERVWLIRGRQIIKRVVRSCVKCQRFQVKNVTKVTAPLPEERLNKSVAFNTTGVDLAGPLLLKGGQKAWIVLFTCAVYRAVHLELATSLSTEAFMMSLRRFFARRGRCSILWSDQGTNFQGAENCFSKIDWKQIVEECAIRRIDWRFNPPSAPWWGGWWERLVGVVKLSIKKTLGRASLSYEEMLTVLADCESVINRRPLTYISDGEVSITPWNFLSENNIPNCEDIDKIDAISLVKRIRYVKQVRNHLRERFRKEYIGALSSRPQRERGSVSKGDIVLVGSDNLKRIMWPLARVTELLPGKDGITRVVKLKLQGGEVTRPVQRVYPLEFPTHSKIAVELEQTVNVEQYNETNKPGELEPVLNSKKFDSSPVEVKTTRHGREVRKPKKLDL